SYPRSSPSSVLCRPTIGDWNCLFRALADQVHGNAMLHGEVRKQICDWIEAHGEQYEGGKAGKSRRGKEKEKVLEGKEGKGKGEGPSKRLLAYLRSRGRMVSFFF
ncbi:hypothetical protein BDZ97DRAFT_1855332, partial [Flammula alnicola]